MTRRSRSVARRSPPSGAGLALPGRAAAAACLLLLLAPAVTRPGKSPDPVNRIFLIGDRAGWVETGLKVKPEDQLTIRSGSEVCFSGGGGESCVRPGGWPRATYAEAWSGDAAECEDPFPDWNHATVVAMIGEEPVEVGRQTVVTGKEGLVRLAINDCSFEGEHGNEGQFSVVLVVESPTALAARGGRELIESALDAMGGKAIRGVKSLGARAACTGPGGPFTTEVLSIFPRQTLFRQSAEEGTAEWLAIGEEAWRIDRELGKRESAKKMIPVIRGHEFHAMLFELDTRFRNHTLPEAGEGETAAADGCVRVEMEDEYGAPAAVCLDAETSLPARLSFQPAGKKKEPPIEIELESWTEIDGVQYLEAFTLRHGEEVFTYRYEEIRPNGVDRSVFKAVSRAALAETRRRLKEEAKGAPAAGAEAPKESADPAPPEGEG